MKLFQKLPQDTLHLECFPSPFQALAKSWNCWLHLLLIYDFLLCDLFPAGILNS